MTSQDLGLLTSATFTAGCRGPPHELPTLCTAGFGAACLICAGAAFLTASEPLLPSFDPRSDMTAALAWAPDQEGGRVDVGLGGGGTEAAPRFFSCSWISARLGTATRHPRGSAIHTHSTDCLHTKTMPSQVLSPSCKRAVSRQVAQA